MHIYHYINFIGKSILLSLILFSNIVFSQDSIKYEEIDKIFKKIENYNSKYKDIEGLRYAKKANFLAEKLKDSKRIAESYYFIALSLANLKLQKQSFQYIQRAYNQKYTQRNVILQAKLEELKAYNYSVVGAVSQDKKKLVEAMNLAKNGSDIESVKLLGRIYGEIGNHFYEQKNMDSSLIYYRLKIKQIKKINKHDIFYNNAQVYIYVARSFLMKKSLDSTFSYIKKSFQEKQKYNDPLMFSQYELLGDYYFEQKKYQEAEKFYLKSLKNMQDHSVYDDYFLNAYKKLSNVYDVLGKKEEQYKYEKIYFEKSKKNTELKNRNIDFALNTILKDNESQYLASQNRTKLLIAASIVLILILIFIGYIFFTKKVKRKNDIIAEAEVNLQYKNDVILQKEIEAIELNQRMNYANQELLDLAKGNSTSFYLRFQELYPGFDEKILKINPNLRTSELTLCAFIFLGFTNKDIAVYTFKSIHTVRNRKHSIRKKLNISSEKDMSIWLNHIIKSI